MRRDASDLQLRERGDRLVDVAIDVELAADHGLNDALLVDDEGHPPGRQPAPHPRDTEGAGDLGVAVTDQRKRQIVLRREGRVSLRAVRAHADNVGVVLGDLRDPIAKTLRLARSPGCEVLGKEVEDQVPPAAEVLRPQPSPVRKPSLERRSRITLRDHARPSPTGLPREVEKVLDRFR